MSLCFLVSGVGAVRRRARAMAHPDSVHPAGVLAHAMLRSQPPPKTQHQPLEVDIGSARGHLLVSVRNYSASRVRLEQ
jgi:hypothetical protein